MLVTFFDLGETVFCRRHPMRSNSVLLLLWLPSPGAPSMGGHRFFRCGGLTTVVVWQVWRSLRPAGCQGHKESWLQSSGSPRPSAGSYGGGRAWFWDEWPQGWGSQIEHWSSGRLELISEVAGLKKSKYLTAGGWSSGPKLQLAHLWVDAGSGVPKSWCQPTGGCLLEFVIKITFLFQ